MRVWKYAARPLAGKWKRSALVYTLSMGVTVPIPQGMSSARSTSDFESSLLLSLENTVIWRGSLAQGWHVGIKIAMSAGNFKVVCILLAEGKHANDK